MSLIDWSDRQDPNSDCSYNHIIGTTPFGEFLLAWKGWKDEGELSAGFDDTPWGDVWYSSDWFTIEGAMEKAEAEMVRRCKEFLQID